MLAYGGGDSKLARKYQGRTLVRIGTLLKKGHQTPESFIKKMRDPVHVA